MPPYVPPKSGDLPEHGKAILAATYTACRKEHPEDSGKELCAKIAWAAVRKDGYHQDSKGHWVQGMNERNITYLASIQPLQAEGKRLAQVYVIDPTLNRAGWKAKPEAIARAKESLLSQPLLYEPGPGEEANWDEPDAPFWGGSHQGEWVRAGKPVSFDRGPDGSYHVIYDITSDHAWEDIVNRRAKAASPSCEIYDAHITRPRDGGPPELELNDLEFRHTLLIPPGGEGAYPNAGVENFWETQASWSGFTGAVASAIQSNQEGNEMSNETLDGTEEEELESTLKELWPETEEDLGTLIREAPVVDLTGEAAKWAQKAVQKPGRVRQYLESRGLIKKDAPIPLSLLQELFKKTKDRSLRAAFLLAIRFKKGLTKEGVVGGAAVPIQMKATRLKELRAERDSLQEKLNTFDSSEEAAQKQDIYTQLGAVNREIDDLRFDIENRLEAMYGRGSEQFTTLSGELLGSEQASNSPVNMPDQPDLKKQLEDTTAELTLSKNAVKDRDTKIQTLEKTIQEAGLSLKAHEEGLGVVHLQAKFKDAQLENDRLQTEIKNTKAYASMVEGLYRKTMVGKIVSARIEGGVLKPNEVDGYTAEAMKLPIDKLDERLAESERFAQAMRDIGLGRRETYGAGAALQPAKKDLGYTLGDLTGVYGGRQQ